MPDLHAAPARSEAWLARRQAEICARAPWRGSDRSLANAAGRATANGAAVLADVDRPQGGTIVGQGAERREGRSAYRTRLSRGMA